MDDLKIVAQSVVDRFKAAAELQTTDQLRDQVKKMDVQIKFCNDIRRRQTLIRERNKLAEKYNRLTGKV